MMLLFVLAQLIITTSAPPLSAAEAAALLARLDSPANRTHVFVCTDCDGPRIAVAPYRPGDGPFGPFPPYSFRALNSWKHLSRVPRSAWPHHGAWAGASRPISKAGTKERNVWTHR